MRSKNSRLIMIIMQKNSTGFANGRRSCSPPRPKCPGKKKRRLKNAFTITLKRLTDASRCSTNNSDSLDEQHFSFISSFGHFQGVDPIRKIVKTIPTENLLFVFGFSLQSTAYASSVIFENRLQQTFLGVVNLKSQPVNKDR